MYEKFYREDIKAAWHVCAAEYQPQLDTLTLELEEAKNQLNLQIYNSTQRESGLRAIIDEARKLLHEVLELYPQTYPCNPGAFKMAHINPEDWKDVRSKIEVVLDRSVVALNGRGSRKSPTNLR